MEPLQVEDGTKGSKPLKSSGTMVNDTKRAMLMDRVFDKPLPCWRVPNEKLHRMPNVEDIIPVLNGLLHVPTGKLLRPTPLFVNSTSLQVAYDANAQCPVWDATVVQWFTPEQADGKGQTDWEAIEQLQLFMGYCLTTDISHQKFLYLLGETRSGKSTIQKVVELMFGASYKAGDEKLVTTDHGLAGLLGAAIVAFGDYRNTTSTTAAAFESFILKSAGGDTQTVNPKGVDQFSHKFGFKIMINSNIFPNFKNEGGSMEARMLLIEMPNSYLGREDHQLLKKLTGELSGILNFALEGLKKLRAGAAMCSPTSSHQLLEGMRRRSDPVRKFLAECTVTEAAESVRKEDLTTVLDYWLAENELHNHISPTAFYRTLAKLAPSLGIVTGANVRERTPDGSQVRVVKGLAFNAKGERLLKHGPRSEEEDAFDIDPELD